MSFITIDAEIDYSAVTMVIDTDKINENTPRWVRMMAEQQIKEDIQITCDHTYQYYGHDHKNDYEKCTKCSHMREVE